MGHPPKPYLSVSLQAVTENERNFSWVVSADFSFLLDAG